MMTRREILAACALPAVIKDEDVVPVELEPGNTYTIFLDARAIDGEALMNLPPIATDCECKIVFVLPVGKQTVKDAVMVVKGKK